MLPSTIAINVDVTVIIYIDIIIIIDDIFIIVIITVSPFVMVARALCRSEAHGVVPWSKTLHEHTALAGM